MVSRWSLAQWFSAVLSGRQAGRQAGSSQPTFAALRQRGIAAGRRNIPPLRLPQCVGTYAVPIRFTDGRKTVAVVDHTRPGTHWQPRVLLPGVARTWLAPSVAPAGCFSGLKFFDDLK